MPWGATNEWGLNEWLNDVNYQRRIGPNERGESIPIPQRKGSFAKGEPNVYVRNHKTDHGGKAYKDIDLGFKDQRRIDFEKHSFIKRIR